MLSRIRVPLTPVNPTRTTVFRVTHGKRFEFNNDMLWRSFSDPIFDDDAELKHSIPLSAQRDELDAGQKQLRPAWHIFDQLGAAMTNMCARTIHEGFAFKVHNPASFKRHLPAAFGYPAHENVFQPPTPAYRTLCWCVYAVNHYLNNGGERLGMRLHPDVLLRREWWTHGTLLEVTDKPEIVDDEPSANVLLSQTKGPVEGQFIEVHKRVMMDGAVRLVPRRLGAFVNTLNFGVHFRPDVEVTAMRASLGLDRTIGLPHCVGVIGDGRGGWGEVGIFIKGSSVDLGLDLADRK